MLIIRGDLVTFDDGHRVVVDGRVLVGADGRIVEVLDAADPVPAAFVAARTVVYDGFIYPGLIDCHNHIPYNTIGLWRIPARTEPFVDHNEWTRPVVYNREITAPQKFLGWAAGPSLLAYVETKALLGGTTTIQGSGRFPARDGALARNLDSERFGGDRDRFRVDTLVKREATMFDDVRLAMQSGDGYIYHLAEGVDRGAMAAEWQVAEDGGVVRSTLVAIHGTGLGPGELRTLADRGATLVWSPFSNMWLYGGTADIVTAKALNLRLCLGSDWAPSGTRNVLGELKVAKLWNEDPAAWYAPGAAVPAPPASGVFSDRELCDLVTRHPGDAVAHIYGPQIGRIQPGFLADLVLVRRGLADPYANLIAATESDVEAVVVGGEARCATPELTTSFGVKRTTILRFVANGVTHERRVLIRNPKNVAETMTWRAVVARLRAVRRNPQLAEQELALALADAAAGLTGPVFVVEGDMPFGESGDPNVAIGGPDTPPPAVAIPPLDPLVHDAAFFDAIDAHSFHRGLLSPLRCFYSS